jgi:alkyl hydroperoxide reductase subunit AhpC
MVNFPEYSKGSWCILFAHPANFTSAWAMFSAFLALKERWLNERNTRILAISNEPIRVNNFSEKARRYIGIYLKAPVVEDLDGIISDRYGIASARRPRAGCNRLAYIIDPGGIIRMVIERPLLPNIEQALEEIARNLDVLQGASSNCSKGSKVDVMVAEQSDAAELVYKSKPAYFSRKKLFPN